jgi:nucleoid-associated protein YgaU
MTADDPEPDDDVDDDVPYAGTQILWGRVLVLLSALALAFWLGTTFSGDDGSRQEIRDQADEIARLQAQIAGLEAEIDARDAADAGASEQATASEPSAVATAEASQRRRDRDQPTDDASAAPANDQQARNAGGSRQDGGADNAGNDGGGRRNGGDDGGNDGGGRRNGGDDGQDDEPPGRRYVVQSGDSLAAIAQEVYGDPTEWRAIARANDLREPFSLTVGEALQIPPSP